MTDDSKKADPVDDGIPILEFDHTDSHMEIERIGLGTDNKATPPPADAGISFSDGGFELSFGDDEALAPAVPLATNQVADEQMVEGMAEAFGIEETNAGFSLDGNDIAASAEQPIAADLEEDLAMFNSTRSSFIIPKELAGDSIEFNPLTEPEPKALKEEPRGPMVIDIVVHKEESPVSNFAPESTPETEDVGFSLGDAETVDVADNALENDEEVVDNFAVPTRADEKFESLQYKKEVAEPPPLVTSEVTTPHRSASASASDKHLDVEVHATLRQIREEREDLLKRLKEAKYNAKELEQDNLTLKAALDESKIEISILRKRYLAELEDVKYRLTISEDKKILADERTKALAAQKEKLEQKVRIDLNLVKQREKELESRLEMLAMDVDAQVQSRDQKILELRRKIDSLEFNMENVSIREQKTSEDKRKIEDKLNKIMKTLRNSIKNLEDDIDTEKIPGRDNPPGKNK